MASLRKGLILLYLLIFVCAVTIKPTAALAATAPVNTWKKIDHSPTSVQLWKVSSMGEDFVAVGEAGTILTSNDGEIWNRMREEAGAPRLNEIAWGDPGYVVVGDGGRVLFSDDGSHWEHQISGTISNIHGVVWGNDKYVAVGDSGSILQSEDGKVWSASTIETSTTHFYGITFVNNQYYAIGGVIGGHDRVIRSLNGEDWEVIHGDRPGYLRQIAWGDDKFVAIGEHGKVRTSSDGEIWQYQDTGVTTHLWDVVWGNKQYIAVGTGGLILTSLDGIAWTNETPLNAGETFYGITSINNKYVAVGHNGAIFHGSYAVNDFNLSTELADDSVTSRTATFQWSQAVDAIDVTLQISPGGDNDWQTAQTFESVEANTTEATVGNLTPGTEYDFRLNVVGAWFDDTSNVVTVTTLNEYALTYAADAGGAIDGATSQTVAHGADGTEVTAVPDAGYRFVQWSDGNSNAARTDTDVRADMSLTASFALNQYALTYAADAGGAIDGATSQTVAHGADGTEVTAVPDAGYRFVQWSDGNSNAARTDTDVRADMSLTASFALNQYEVTFEVNGGSIVPSVLANYGTSISEPAAPTRNSYSFEGWYKADDLVEAWLFDQDTVTSEITLYAKWRRNITESYMDNRHTETEDYGLEIIINGNKENQWASATSTVQEGMNVTLVKFDEEPFYNRLQQEQVLFTVIVPVMNDADIVTSQIDGKLVKLLEEKQAIFKIETKTATYSIPASNINIDAISKKISSTPELQHIKLNIEIAAPSAEQIAMVDNASRNRNFTTVSSPINFTITANYGDSIFEINHYPAYVERMIMISESTDAKQVTTAIVIEPDGTVRHIPTKMVEIDGMNYARINSLTDSTYVAIRRTVDFKDVVNHWAQHAVNDMGSRAVLNGIGNHMFSPDRDITRAEFAAIMVRGLGLKLENGSTAFLDVNPMEWYNSAIHTAYSYSLISGFEDGTFRPTDSITREQAITIMAKAMTITGLKAKLATTAADEALSSFTDVVEISDWAKNSIADCLQAGIVYGRSNTIFSPKDYITRAEVAVIIQRLLQKSELI